MSTTDVTPGKRTAAAAAAAAEPGDGPQVQPKSEASEHEHNALSICRIALAVLRLPADAEHMAPSPASSALSQDIDTALRAALNADHRVTEVLPEREGALSVDNAKTINFHERGLGNDELVDDAGYRGFRLGRRLMFRVRVPVKNQPTYRGRDDVPVDTYLAAWNGVMLIVQWDQDSNAATASGGHVVLDVLRDVVASAGQMLELIPCSHGCFHGFLHVDVLCWDGPRHPTDFTLIESADAMRGIVAPFSRMNDDIDNVVEVFDRLYSTFEKYACAKTVGDRIVDLEDQASGDSAVLMAINYKHASRAGLPRPRAFTDAWRLIGSRKYSRKLIARMWLAVALIERQERYWRQLESRFRSSLEKNDLQAFGEDFDVHSDEIRSLDLALVKTTLNDMGTRFDNRSIVWATALGAAAGIAGAVVGGIGS